MPAPFPSRWHLFVPVALLAGCAAISTGIGYITGSTQEKKARQELSEVQLGVMRMADDYVAQEMEASGNVQASTLDKRIALVGWQLRQATAAYEIATGVNPVLNLLDLVVLATLTRSSVESYWVPEVFGESGRPLLATLQANEARAWEAVSRVLKPDAQAALREAIAEWQAANPQVREVAGIRFVNVLGKASRGGTGGLGTPSSVLAAFGLDVFGQLDPAVAEVERTRILAERAFYYSKRAPALLDLQARLLVLRLAREPESQQVLADAERISRSAESFARLADGVPALVDREREAAIRQFLEAVASQEGKARALLAEMKGALDAGTSAATAANGAIRSLDSLLGTLNPPSPPGSPPSKPFDVNEYTRALAELGKAANDVHALVASIERDAPRLEAVVRRATRGASEDGRDLVDYAFRRGVTLLSILIGGIFAAALVYRWAALRMAARRRPPP